MIFAATDIAKTTIRTAAARRNEASRKPRSANVATMVDAKTSAPSWVKARVSNHDENECRPGGGPFRIMADGERRPEQGVREPHLGRKAEDQRAEQGRRTTGVDEDDAAA